MSNRQHFFEESATFLLHHFGCFCRFHKNYVIQTVRIKFRRKINSRFPKKELAAVFDLLSSIGAGEGVIRAVDEVGDLFMLVVEIAFDIAVGPVLVRHLQL